MTRRAVIIGNGAVIPSTRLVQVLNRRGRRVEVESLVGSVVGKKRTTVNLFVSVET
jgi:hypothetical protein